MKMSPKYAIFSLFLTFFFLGSFLSPAVAELAPENVAIIATQGDENSLKIARHYALTRKIPPQNVFLLRDKHGEWISREVWEDKLRPELKKWLQERPEIKCVVCCWSVPLKIGAVTMTSPQNEARRYLLDRARKENVLNANVLIGVLNAIGTKTGTGEAPSLAENVPLQQIAETMEKALQESQKRLLTLPEDRKKVEAQRIQYAFQRLCGLQGFANLLAQQEKLAPTEAMANDAKIRSTVLKVEIKALTQMLKALASLPETSPRDAEILLVLQRMGGVIGTLQWVDIQLTLMGKNESYASFDSELSAIYQEGYPLMQWIPNYMSFYAVTSELAPKEPGVAGEAGEAAASAAEAIKSVRGGGVEADDAVNEQEEEEEEAEAETEDVKPRFWRAPPPLKPVLMVARLEAPRVLDVIRLIDDSQKAEAQGLQGTVYLDARRSRPGGTPGMGSYEKADQSLHDLALRLKECTEMNVVLDEKGDLLKPEDCPTPAALYCGWYSLGDYKHACEWGQGSVGYHMASMEAESLKSGKLWCPRMLERGVAATLGPTFEPYLSAFPQPDEFFSLVLTGKFTMIECYYYTKPFNSWVMTYVGDPLYIPYKNNPQLEMDEIPETLQRFFIKK